MALNNSDYLKKLELLIDTLIDDFDDIDIYNNSLVNDTFVNQIDFENWSGNETNSYQQQLDQVVESMNSTINNYFKNKDIFSILSTLVTPLDDSFLPTFHLLIDGYAVSILASIGIILNVLGGCFLLAGRRMGKMFSLLLSALLGFDLFFLLFGVMRSLQNHFFPISARYLKMYHVIVNSGMRFSQISSIFMVVSLAYARHSAIKHPIQNSRLYLSWKKTS